ncbi:MAG TPA: hypothetical protein VGA78_07770, partial [Gemmatimonadales bacterium]
MNNPIKRQANNGQTSEREQSSRRRRRNAHASHRQSLFALWLAMAAIFFGCGDTSSNESNTDEPVARVEQALTTEQLRILNMNGAIGTGPNIDWSAVSGTATSSTIAAEGGKAIKLSANGSWNPAVVSRPLSSLGPIGTTATVKVRLAGNYVAQGSWYGQLAMFLNAPSRGIFNQYVGPVALSGPLGTWKEYSLPLPASITSALSDATDLTIRLEINGSSPNNVIYLDQLSFGTPSGATSTGAGGTTSGSGSTTTGSGGTTSTNARILGAEDPVNDWTPFEPGAVVTRETLHTEGSFSMSVDGSGWTPVVSA